MDGTFVFRLRMMLQESNILCDCWAASKVSIEWAALGVMGVSSASSITTDSASTFLSYGSEVDKEALLLTRFTG
jgi:hypothetical protein